MIDFTKTKFLNFQNWNLFRTGVRLMEFKLETKKAPLRINHWLISDLIPQKSEDVKFWKNFEAYFSMSKTYLIT